MKKIGILVGVLVLALALVAGVSADESAANDDTTLIVGFDAEFPPYGYKAENGSYTGFDLELAQEVCKRNNWTFKAQPIDWDAKDSELSSGTIDCIWNGFSITDDRKDKYTWSKPYIDNKQVVVVKSDSGINSLADLKDKQVETQKDSSALSALQGDNKTIADTFKNLVQIADYNTAFNDLASGACDAVAMDYNTAKYQVKEHGADTYKILDENITSEDYGIGFKLGNDDLKDKVQATLDEMQKDGTIAKIAQNYADYGVPESLITE
ncbi:amino acid ABC transporter substrate-binding protein [Methanosphaera sp.]|uniref:amino acid ABC transporter substrate-binding protein n=1 Tax=Methanosphaera sp. TaxID=2666342 RepID=UPI0025E5909B|nr:amino acid ABC transporter substrate-binding protein [Methanosphaera sp.]MBE6486825.1 amino acid ABC transporter substrate-binding protein [Methanosphaera stadtmanae]MEE1117974.1 amino acid ABC transporter substrate-binding protein [Methanosphaera sp.]MEE3324629.1 amino acid ABC transporter substrate-binding protein [Methanosphaera sp.]